MKRKNNPWVSLSMLLFSLVLINSCKKEITPLLITTNVTDFAITTAISGGNVTSDGGASVTARGVCWSLNPAPTIADNKTSDGTGAGSFSSSISGLTANTTYCVRAYATNTVGTGYGNEVTFTTYGLMDIDGNGYHTIKIGTQEWMKENLKTRRYRDGSEIPNITQDAIWINLSIGAYCDFNNDVNNAAIYGRLYNWYAVMDPRNVCPGGWHVPSLSEWDILINTLGGEDIAGGKMKSTGTLQNRDGQWNFPNTGATNTSGFSGLPGGTRFDAGDFRDLYSFGHWWSSVGGGGHAWSPRLQDNNTIVEKYNNYATLGHSVRCVRD